METALAATQSASHDRVQRLSTTRASSRSSTSTASDNRVPHQAADRLPSSMSPSPQVTPLSQQRTSHLVHRFQPNSKAPQRLALNNTDDASARTHHEPNSRGSDPKLATTAMSAYLQEKLVRERRVENERSASRMSNDAAPPAPDMRATQSSPVRSPHDSVRPRSSSGYLDGGKRKGVSLKEMEQTMTTLHKQNFDLKLELYHRREKQTNLEKRCDNLETEKRELEDINDKLMTELEMRDKAVEEAVSMIISLEARMEQLLREREMVQQVEKNNMFATDETIRRALSSALGNAPFDASSFGLTPTQKRKVDDARSLNRMPSFVSERSENTDNLRNVYLSARGGNSLLSLPDVDFREAANRMGSPNLSVLSESSFLSIYGKKANHADGPITPVPPALPRHSSPGTGTDLSQSAAEPPPDIEMESSNASPAAIIAHTLAATAPPTVTTSSSRSVTSKSSTPTKSRSASLAKASHGSAPYISLTELISTNSPLQRLERMDTNARAVGEAVRHGGPEDQAPISNSPLGRRWPLEGVAAKREEKHTVRTIVPTDSSFSGDLSSPSNLPPTPDTISTSTLRRYKNSFDTLSQEREAANEKKHFAVKGVDEFPSVDLDKQSILDTWDPSNLVMQPPSITAFDSRRHDMAMQNNYIGSRLEIPVRPRSADETTISRHGRSSGWGDSDSSDDDMEIDGNDSASLHDFWLRESLRPSDQGLSHTNKTKLQQPGRVSPDLFRFPSTSNGWATTAMFGTLGGHGYLGAGAAPLAQKMDALGDSLPTPVNGTSGISGLLASPIPYGVGGMPTGPPPPPNRRSSLHAQTGSTRELSGFNSSSRNTSRHGPPTPITPTIPGGSMSAEKRRKPRIQGGSVTTPASKTMSHGSGAEVLTPESQPPIRKEQTTLSKQRHYPPTSASNNAAPRSSRVLSLFRRSGSHETASPSVPDMPVSAPATSSGLFEANSNKTDPMPFIGVPSKARRDELDADGGASATPPPILRNPRTHTSDGMESHAGCIPSVAGEAIEDLAAYVSASPARDVTASTTQPTPSMKHTQPTQQPISHQVQGNTVAEPSSTLKTRKKWLGLGRVAGLQTRTS